ncbi:MAG TPA: glutathione peroxidase [Saprospiraceae bacterium]|nr:glutathione peroxidase [Saprospiraceae bacterium]
MRHTFFLALVLLSTLPLFSQSRTFYDFSAMDIDGHLVPMSTFKGKKVLVVNVASECGNTPQYAKLEELYEKYGPDNFVIVGFPANNFGAQEPGSNADIKKFCTSTYHVTFPMMAKISVTGDDIDPLYKWLTTQAENGILDAPVTWNFQKFMIDETGHLVGFVKPKIQPDSEEVLDWIIGKSK